MSNTKRRQRAETIIQNVCVRCHDESCGRCNVARTIIVLWGRINGTNDEYETHVRYCIHENA